jgi:TetR/AcrR family transcriptional regulator, cholesterol catabolism regulator
MPVEPTRSSRAFASGQQTHQAIRAVATRLFREHGYEATSMRHLAKEVGIEAASLYNHFPSKHQLLADVLISTMRALIEELHESLAQAPPTPAERLAAVVSRYVLFHREHLSEAYITDTERRSLQPTEAAQLLALREELSEMFHKIISEGNSSGAFDVEDVGIATLGVLSICARIPVWYREDGRLTLDKIAEVVSKTALRAVGARPPRKRPRG